MDEWLVIAVALLADRLAAAGPDQGHGHQRGDHSARSGAEFLQEPAGHLHRREHGHRHQLEGQHLHLPSRQRDAAVRIHAAGPVHPRDRPQQLRLLVRALGARRRPGQHLGGRRRHRHARQVQPRGQGADDDRPPRGSGRHARQHARRRPLPRPQREVPLRPPDRRRLRSAGQHLRLRRLLRRPRREVRQERPLREGGRHARQRATCSSTRRTRSPPISRATSTSAIAATRACRCSTTT